MKTISGSRWPRNLHDEDDMNYTPPEANSNLAVIRTPASVWNPPRFRGVRPRELAMRVAAGVCGGMLVLQSRHQRNRADRARALVGAGLVFGAAAGRDNLTAIWHRMRRLSRELGLDERIELASEESFPASDAPSWTPTVGTGVRRPRLRSRPPSGFTPGS
jgi:hypothetical protein